MKTLLVPLDGSAIAERILPYVRTLAPSLGARVCLLQVISDPDGDGLLADSIAATYGVGDPLATQHARWQHSLDLLRQNAERYLESQAASLQGAGLDVAVDVRCGPAADVIVEAAGGEHVAMIAMATHGYGGLKRWALGSVTDKVVHATSTPVFIARGVAPAQVPAFKRILVPLDGSTLARQALPLATELARSAHAELLLLQAIPPMIEAYPGFPPRGRPIPQLAEVLAALRDGAMSELGALADELRTPEMAVRAQVVNGHAAEVLVDEAEQGGVDLIVMATHGYSGLRRWALGSVADKVLHATTTPLILVHARSQN
jgi:nucleotide-binding universal stress UspA family protein